MLFNIIPDQSHTFSKAYHQYPALISPRYVSKAYGVTLETDKGIFTDWSMGLGPVIKGYAFKELKNYIFENMNNGFAFSLPSKYEYEIAQKLITKLDYGEQVRFAKNGSDATSASVRIARHFTKKDLVLCNGYHGWQDWYIGTTTRDGGVLKEVKNKTISIPGFNKKSLEENFKVNKGNIACLIIEPMIGDEPNLEYLITARDLCTRENALLIFDECWTGFRCHEKGAIGLTGVEPDLSCYAKALGNGVPVSALVGKEEIMRNFETVFYSFTHSSDPIGLSAADFMMDYLSKDFFDDLSKKTSLLKKSISMVLMGIRNPDFKINVTGYNGKIIFNPVNDVYRLKIKTQIQKTFIEHKHLFNMYIAVCEDHSENNIKSFLKTLKVFVNQINEKKYNIDKSTEKYLVKDVFRRIT